MADLGQSGAEQEDSAANRGRTDAPDLSHESSRRFFKRTSLRDFLSYTPAVTSLHAASGPLRLITERLDEVRTHLRAMLAAVDCDTLRPVDIVAALGLDKSLASRLARGLRESDPQRAAVELPAPEGLGLVITACEQRGAPDGIVTHARGALAEFHAALKALPGGRAALLAAFAPTVEQEAGHAARSAPANERKAERAERTARRAAFTAASFLHGLETDLAFFQLLLAPGSEPGRLDQAMVSGSIGTRRLRAGPPVTLGAVHGSRLNEGPPKRTTLSGGAITEDPTVALLPEFCSGVREHVQVERRGQGYRLWVREEEPPLDSPVDLVYGVRNLNFVERRASDRLRWACTNYIVCRPTRRLVLEVALPVSVFGGEPPMLRASIDPFAEPDPIGGPHDDRRDSLSMTARFRRVAAHARTASPDDLPSAALARAFDLLGWDPRAFQRHRLELDYPTMFVGLQMWYALESR
jgi:hypothetical protein